MQGYVKRKAFFGLGTFYSERVLHLDIAHLNRRVGGIGGYDALKRAVRQRARPCIS